MGLIKHSIAFSVATFISRAVGYVRDALIAYYFGVSSITDAFFVAFRLPNTFRRLFGEGGFNAAFVPIYAKNTKEGKEKEFLQSTFTYYLLINLFTTLLLVLFAEQIISLIAPGIKAKSYFDLAVFMGKWIFLYLFFVGLSAFFMAVLNTKGVFFVPAFAQAVFNAVFSLTITVGSNSLGYYSLIAGVLVGGLFQLLFHVFFLKGAPIGISFKRHSDVKLLLKRLLPALMGFGIAQLSFFIDTFLASFLALGSISYLYYANRIFQLPLGAISVGMANSLLSALSHGEDKTKSTTLALRFILLLSFPAVVGLLVFAEQIVELLYGRGMFLENDVKVVGMVLQAYSLGLVFFSLQKALSSVFFARGDTFTPVKASFWGIIFEGLTAYLYAFVLKLGVIGLALGTASSSVFSFAYLLKKTYKIIDWRDIFSGMVKIVFASLLMGWFGFTLKGISLLISIPACALAYFAVLLLLREKLLILALAYGNRLTKKHKGVL
ncbi:murein biosynthesis integral membrane protein MurJ [Thermocrinis sp.]|uniref:murein biosynthesis integral membrane protein MurJ n=1 Tax=Thermocrinis sp. TaxID=2024383 RepID=UPI002FDCF454